MILFLKRFFFFLSCHVSFCRGVIFWGGVVKIQNWNREMTGDTNLPLIGFHMTLIFFGVTVTRLCNQTRRAATLRWTAPYRALDSHVDPGFSVS